MPTELAVGRARSDIDVMSRAGLPLNDFFAEAADTLQRVVPFVAACLSTLDPATSLVSSVGKSGELRGRNESDVAWAQIEYGGEEPTALVSLIAAGRGAIDVRTEFGGDIERSVRMADLVIPQFGFVEEARVVFTDRNGAWGAASLFRGPDDRPFDDAELGLLDTVAPSFTRGIRSGLLAQSSRADATSDVGPAVIIVDANDRIVQSSPGAQAHLARMALVPNTGDPLTLVYSLVSGARRFARGDSDRMPRIRVRASDGVWLVAHATPLVGADDRAGDVVVTIEEARPQEVVDLVAAAFDLTARERDVTGRVLRGADTKEIAMSMHVSPYTVQDHLKSIFDKAGVTSRRELVARIYFDQYAPRIGGDIGKNGWFAG